MDELLTLAEIGQRLKMTKEQVYQITRRRSLSRMAAPLPVIRIGKALRIRASSLDAWLKELEANQRVQ